VIEIHAGQVSMPAVIEHAMRIQGCDCVRMQLAFPSMRNFEARLFSTSSIVPKRFSTRGNNQWIRVMAKVNFLPVT
jgi:hypothetical protein